MSSSDTICNDSDPPLADIVLSSFPFRASPQGFKAHLLGEGFYTLINGVLFSSPTNMGHHILDLRTHLLLEYHNYRPSKR